VRLCFASGVPSEKRLNGHNRSIRRGQTGRDCREGGSPRLHTIER